MVEQNRASTEVLRQTWLQKVGWTPQEAPANWASVTKTPPAKEFTPKVGTQTCDMDHIVELQIGGTNAAVERAQQ